MRVLEREEFNVSEKMATRENDQCLQDHRNHYGNIITVNIKKERSEKTNGIFSELCQMFPQTKSVFKAAQSAWNNSETITCGV